ncbi:MAG TPA: TonB-dependent receptor [Thermoanaerobaculia bacterium]|nr:TonB-dependent receptor [Thermoanaerobaculia bacterium]
MHHRSRSLFFALTFVLCIAGTALAQSGNLTTGGITGKVTDSSGGALPGVTVTATNQDTGLSRNVVTESDGQYLIGLLQPGRYRVEAELAGLGKAAVPNVTVLLGNNTKTDINLNPQVSETVTVTATAPVVDPTQSGLSNSVTEKQIENLPILTRDFRALATLTPGVNESFGGRVQANGARGIGTDYNIDGANSNSEFFGEQTGGTRAPFTFSQAAIKEFQVIRSQYNAEYARGVGATLNAITKSGTNDVDGEVFAFLRKKSWAATRPTVINGITASESFRAKDSTQPGFAIGGPIMRDRLFYFLNADFQRQKLPILANDFTTRAEFTALPAATQQAFFNKYQAIVGYPYQQETTYDQTFDQNTYLVKLDANVGSNNHFSLRDNYSDFHNANNQTGFQLLSNQGDEHDKFNQLVGTGETVFTNSLFNQVIAQYEKQERPIDPTVSGFPETTIRIGTATMTFGNINFLPNNTTEKKYQLKDSLTYILGANTFKGGVEYLSVDFANLFPRFSRGQYQYNSVQDFINNVPSRFQQGLGPKPTTTWTARSWGAFIQDSLKPFDRLTVDVGVRYDTQDLPDAEPAGNALKYPALFEGFGRSNSAVSPRIGLAYDLFGNGRSVIRGGTGLFYNFLPMILVANPLSQVNGWFNQINIACTTTATNPCPVYPGLLTPAQFAALPPASNAIQTITSDFKPQKSWRTSAQFMQQIGTSYSVGIGGEYAKLTQVQGKTQLNAVPLGYSFGNVPVYSVTAAGRPLADYGSVLADFSGEEANSRSFTVETHKLALNNSRFSWDAHYTWAKSIDQESNERSTSTTFLYDINNVSLSEGPADFDIRHRVVLDGVYELPWGIVVAGIFNWRSGVPYTAGISCNCGGQSLNGLINVSGNIPVFVNGSGQVIDLTPAINMTRPQFAAYLASQGAVIEGRNQRRQPSVTNLDARVSKRFGLLRGVQLELVGEVFNVLNKKNTFITTANTAYWNVTLNTGTDRFTAITRNATFGVPTSYNTLVDPRQFQVAAKIIF